VPGGVSASSRTGAKVLACGTALFAAAFAAGVAVRRDDARVTSPVAAVRPAVPVAGLAPATALPVLRDAAPRAVAVVARRRPARAASESGSRAAGTEVAVRPADSPRRRSDGAAPPSRPVIVAARPAPTPQVPFTPVRHTVPAVRPVPAAPASAPATAATRAPAAKSGGSVTFFSDGGG